MKWAPLLDPSGKGWNRAMRKRMHNTSGVYAIRKCSGEVLYVGESHTRRAWKTMLRHFQGLESFSKAGDWVCWGCDAKKLQIFFRKTLGRNALKVEAALIRKLKPSGNVDISDASDEVPF